jgi:two-component system, NarL family, nitrate/nitrite response regulator NarL
MKGLLRRVYPKGQAVIKDHYRHAVASGLPANSFENDSTQTIATKLLCGNALLQAGLTQLLSGTCFNVLTPTSNGLATSPWLAQSEPALYIVDATGSSEQALEFIRDAKKHHPDARVIAIAHQFDFHTVQSSVSAGVDSFCLATSAREVLIKVLELTMLGERILPGSVVRTLLNQELAHPGTAEIIPLAERRASDPKAQKLSPRETVILQSLMGGDPNKVIARKLEITEATIKVHVKAILRKIGVANRTQAAMWATGNLRETGPSAGEFHEVRRLS